MLPGRLRYLQTLSYLSILSFLPSDQPCHSLMMHHEFCRLSRIVRGSRNDCLKTAMDEIQWIEAAGSYSRIVPQACGDTGREQSEDRQEKVIGKLRQKGAPFPAKHLPYWRPLQPCRRYVPGADVSNLAISAIPTGLSGTWKGCLCGGCFA